MMKKFLKLTLAVALMLCATAASAQKFGRVDLAAIVPNMPEFKEAQTNLEAYGTDLQNQLEQIQVEFNQKYVEYEKNVSTYTDAIRQMKEQELTEIQERYNQYQQQAAQDMQTQQSVLMQPVYEKANNAIQKVAKANGFAAVFDLAAGPMVYYDETLMTNLMPLVYTELGIDPADAAAKIEAANAPAAQPVQ